MATPKEVMKVCTFMAASYPTFRLQKETVDAYAKLLADVDASMLATAAEQACNESEFFPTVAAIRKKIHAINAIANPIPDHTQAWDEMMREVRRVGYEAWMDTRFSTEMIREIVKIYWRDACLTDIDNMNTLRAQFRDSYNARVSRMEQQRAMLPASNELIKQLAGKLDMGRRLLSGGDNDDH